MNADYKRRKKKITFKLTYVNSATITLIRIWANDILLMFQTVSGKLFSTRIKNVISRFDMGFSPLLPLSSCRLIDDWYCYLFLHDREYHYNIYGSKILGERHRKEELSFCSIKITIFDRRRSSTRFSHILTNSLVIRIFNNGLFVFFLFLFCRRYG